MISGVHPANEYVNSLVWGLDGVEGAVTESL